MPGDIPEILKADGSAETTMEVLKYWHKPASGSRTITEFQLSMHSETDEPGISQKNPG